MLPSDVASEATVQQHELAAKGRDLYQALEEAIAQRGETWVPPPEIAPFYNTSIDNPEMPTAHDSVVESGSLTEDYVLYGASQGADDKQTPNLLERLQVAAVTRHHSRVADHHQIGPKLCDLACQPGNLHICWSLKEAIQSSSPPSRRPRSRHHPEAAATHE